jgi:hypothetical protein
VSPQEQLARHINRLLRGEQVSSAYSDGGLDSGEEWYDSPNDMSAFFIDWLHSIGEPICKERGHDYSMKVAQTSNMYLCFRCGEPGWEVPQL